MSETAKSVFDREIAPLLTGESSDDAIRIFAETSNDYFNQLVGKLGVTERQRAALVGMKDEFFVEHLINHILAENSELTGKFYCKKVTSNETSGIKQRTVIINDEEVDLTIGGDCVIFESKTDKPVLIIECKEYIDMVRMKELIGESRVVKDRVTNSKLNHPNVQFWVFAEVLELTKGWSYLLDKSDLKYRIDQIFVVRDGKRRDTANKPNMKELERFRLELFKFLKSL
jgi:hypothetical protein